MPYAQQFSGCEGPLVDCLIKEPPLSDLFSVVRIAWTAVVTDRGHTGPVKNGDAFERLGTMTTLADRKDTVKLVTFSARETSIK